jgi:uncharacterized protein involved in exopolysaccharide biosynthesis
MLFFFKTIVVWRKFILAAGLGTAAVTAAISLFLPKWYTATTSVFPPETTSGVPMYTELIESLSLPLLSGLGAGAAPETIYIDMMRSRRIGEQVIEEFDLMDRYRAGRIEEALEELRSHTGFTLLENGLLVITFEDRDPDRAAAIANRMVQLLDGLNRELNVKRAGRTREFIESQMTIREAQLAEAETALRRFQEEYRTLELEEQLRSAMEIVGTLTAQAIALETELEILSHYTSTSSEEYVRKQREYNEVVRQLSKLKAASGDDDEDLVRSFIPTLSQVPKLALEFMRLRRKVEIESTVYTMLVKEFEKARIEEARDTPTVQVLDLAQPPSIRSRPQRKLLVLAGALLGLAWSALLALFVTSWRTGEGRAGTIHAVLEPVVGDLARLFRRGRRPTA